MLHHFLGMSTLVSYLLMTASPQCTTNRGQRCNRRLVSPQNGHIVGNCRSILGSVCNFRCREGYEMRGAASVRCDENTGRWSARPPRCVSSARYETSSCVVLDAPVNGRKSGRCYEGAPIGSVCSFTCNNGFTLNGRSSLVCQVDGNWDFEPPSCQLLSDRNSEGVCPPLVSPRRGTYTGDCSPGIQGRSCIFSCFSGTVLVGYKSLHCNSNGQWSSNPPVCREVTCRNGQDCSYVNN